MKFKLIITNSTNRSQNARLLYAINLKEKNFGLPEGVTLKLKHKTVTYEQMLQYFMMKAVLIKFISSTNNRHLYFWYSDAVGAHHPMEPQKNIDGKPRKRYRGEKFKFGNNVIYEGDLFTNLFIKPWNPNKWNILDTHETAVWTFSNFIQLYLGANEIFELQFTLIT